MSRVYEATVLPATGGFGMFQRASEAPNETEHETIEQFADFMDREYLWAWADDIDGKIYEQNGGRPFRWRLADVDGWSYGLIYVEDEGAQ
jgi:hypothetical protein